MRTNGVSLPIINSAELSGVTASCSMVPRSRSRTIAAAVNWIVRNSKIMPIIAGTML